jgi:L-malate glycosyltransferase
MNILYLNNSAHLGGDTKCILKLCKEFKKNNKVIMVSSGGICEEEFENIGIEHYCINDVENKSLLNILNNCITLRRLVKENNIQIIHSHHRMTTLIAKISCKFMKVNIIHTQHLCINDKYKLSNIALRNINIITVSKEAKKILLEKSKLKDERIKTIYNSIEIIENVDEVDPRLVEMKKKGFFIVCQVSRVIHYKGIYDFVEVARKTIENNDNIRFVFIGDGPEMEELQNYIDKERLNNYVLLLGIKKNIIDHLKYINLFILCSYIEGLPLTPIEAFSQSIPVIGTNIGGTNEEIIDGVNGYLVTPKDIGGFVDKILYLYNNKEVLTYMGNKAYEVYLDKFNETQYIEEHNKIYSKVSGINE